MKMFASFVVPFTKFLIVRIGKCMHFRHGSPKCSVWLVAKLDVWVMVCRQLPIITMSALSHGIIFRNGEPFSATDTR